MHTTLSCGSQTQRNWNGGRHGTLANAGFIRKQKKEHYAQSILALAAVAATSPDGPKRLHPANRDANTPAVNSPNSPPNPGAPVAGANSFTEGQAKSRIEDKGFKNVSGLQKDGQRCMARQGRSERQERQRQCRFPGKCRRALSAPLTQEQGKSKCLKRSLVSTTATPRLRAAVRELEAAGVEPRRHQHSRQQCRQCL